MTTTAIETTLTRHYTPEVIHTVTTTTEALDWIAKVAGYEGAAEAIEAEVLTTKKPTGWVWGTHPAKTTLVTIGYGEVATGHFTYVLHASEGKVAIVRGAKTHAATPVWEFTGPAYIGDITWLY